MTMITTVLRADKYWVTVKYEAPIVASTCYRTYLFKAYSPAKSNIDLMLPPPSWRPKVAFSVYSLIMFGVDI